MNTTSTEMEAKIGNVVYLVLKKKKLDAHKIVKDLKDELIKRLTKFTNDKFDVISSALSIATDKDGVLNLILLNKAIHILQKMREQEFNNLSKNDQDMIEKIIVDAKNEDWESTSDNPESLNNQGFSNNPENSNNTETSDNQGASSNPGVSENPEPSNNQETSYYQVDLENPKTSDNAESSNNLEKSDNPESSNNPETSDNPEASSRSGGNSNSFCPIF